MRPTTPSQTVGPYLAIGLTWDDGEYVVAEDHPDAITVTGRLFDGEGRLIPDGMVESWQADPDGRFAHPSDPRGAQSYEGFRGFARSQTAPDGAWRIVTLKPGRVPGDAGGPDQAPHLDVSIFARGLVNRVVTRIYFDDEVEANATDPVLRRVETERVGTLIAVGDPDEPRRYVLDLVLQGEGETVFFDV